MLNEVQGLNVVLMIQITMNAETTSIMLSKPGREGNQLVMTVDTDHGPV